MLLVYTAIYKVLYILMDLDTSFRQLQTFDVDELDSVEAAQRQWIDEAKMELKCTEEDNLTADLFARPNKPVLCRWLGEARDIMCRQREMIESLKEVIGTLKTEALGDKSTVINLQGELLERKEEQLASLQTAVRTSVQDVKTEILTYSDALKMSTTAAAITPGAFKTVVKEVIAEEDRSKNLMVFGLAEEAGEKLDGADGKISAMFQELDEKPRCSAVRVGKAPTTSASCRPVKVTLTSSTAVRQLLMKAKLLKEIERLKAVYLGPDRSPADRASQRQLIAELKKKKVEQTTHEHFIRGGKVVSRAKA